MPGQPWDCFTLYGADSYFRGASPLQDYVPCDLLIAFKRSRILLANVFPSTKTLLIENYLKYLWLALNSYLFIFKYNKIHSKTIYNV
jgi:hypothetical protein